MEALRKIVKEFLVTCEAFGEFLIRLAESFLVTCEAFGEFLIQIAKDAQVNLLKKQEIDIQILIVEAEVEEDGRWITDKSGVPAYGKTKMEEDGRWIAEVRDMPGVIVYGKTRAEAITKVILLAKKVSAGANIE
ncbi:MAG: hypothetical protein AB1861_08440 [Cyanobacteriota bacterium]